MTASPQEVGARMRVAHNLARILVAHGATADTVEEMPDEAWVSVCRLAGRPEGYVPSAETRAMVVALLIRSSELAADPFGAFG